MKRIGFYAGSFDPVTNGHIDIIRQALSVVDELVIGIGIHDAKKALFSFEDRQIMIKEACFDTGLSQKIKVVPFQNLVVAAARSEGASFLVRGLRDTSDFDSEMRMATLNAQMMPQLQTIFLAASPETRSIASSLIKQIAMMKGEVAPFVPSSTLHFLQKRFL